MEEEIWRDIPEYEGLYQISNIGRIKSLNYNHTKKEGFLKQYLDKKGYMKVTIYKNKKANYKQVHQLVAITFLNHKPCGHKWVVNHKNFIRTDNRLENLEVVSNRQNTNQKHLKSSSKYTGVFWNKRANKWCSGIHMNNKRVHLGYFDDEKEASEYYENAVLALKEGTEIQIKPNNFTSKYKGVYWDKRSNKWKSKITIKGKEISLGTFNDEKEASKYYENALIAIEKGESIEVKRRESSSIYKGVSWNKKSKKWSTQIYINGKKKNLGNYLTEIEAAEAVNKALGYQKIL